MLNDYLRRQRLPEFSGSLMRAALSGDLAALKLLETELESERLIEGSTPLIAAVRGGGEQRVRSAEWLAAKGADLNQTDQEGDTALHHACYAGDREVVECLLTLHANTEVLNEDHHTPLTAAAALGHWELVRRLHKAGANLAPERGIPPLHAAASIKDDDSSGVVALLELGADVNGTAKLGRTALMGAAMVGNVNICDALLQRGAQINARDDFGNTALMEAARCGANRVLEKFLFWHPETEHRDKPGRTALLVAVSSRRTDEETIRMLIAMGADISVRNREGRSAAELASAAGRIRIAKALGGGPKVDNMPTAEPAYAATESTSELRSDQGTSTNRINPIPPAEATVHTAAAPTETTSPLPPWITPENESTEPTLEPASEEGTDIEQPTTAATEDVESDIEAPAQTEPEVVEDAEQTAGEMEPTPTVGEGDPGQPNADIDAPSAPAPAPEHRSHDQADDAAEQTQPVSNVFELNAESVIAPERPPVDLTNPALISLRDAVRSGDEEELASAVNTLADGPLPGWMDIALMDAVSGHQAQLIGWLHEHGANINARNDDDQSLLEIALANDDFTSVAALLDHGASANTDPSPLLSLMRAQNAEPDNAENDDQQQRARMIDRLCEAGANVRHVTEGGKTALHLATQHYGASLVQALLAHGADANARDDLHDTPLLIACRRTSGQRLGIIRQLIKHGADAHLTNRAGQSPISLTLESDEQNLLKMLMMADGTSRVPMKPDVIGDSDLGQQLIHASADGNLGRVKRLLGRSVDLDSRDSNGCTALLRACGAGHPTIVSALLSAGANPDLVSSNNMSPLGVAVLGNHRGVVRMLLDRNIEVDQAQQMGITPLMLASAQWNSRMVGLLLRNGADVNASDESDTTALMAAAQNALHSSDTEAAATTLRNLLNAGAQINARNEEGQSPLLLLLGVRANQADEADGSTLSRLAFQLIEAGAEPDYQDMAGWTALHACAVHGFTDAAEVLLEAGACPDLRDINGQSARDLAADHQQQTLLELFDNAK